MRKLFTRYSIIAILAIGFLAFSVPVSSQTVTLGNGTSYNSTTGYPSPYGLWYRTNRNQYIITASELSSLGITAGCNITAIGFNVHATNNHSSVPAWLKIGTTTLSSFPSGTWQTGATQKWSSTGYLTSNGWNTHTFSSNWMYNGGNVLIDMCIGSTSINYTRNASVYYHSATNTVLWNRSDGTDYCSGVGSGNRNSNRPNMQITFIPSTGFDIKMASIDSPYVLGVGKNKVVVTIQNARADTIYWCDLGYKINNNTPVLVNNFSGFPNGKLEAGQSYQYTFSDSLNIPSSGYYTLKAWVNNANDSMPDNDRTNDTITMTVCTGLAGTYTIGATGDYLNFNNAVAALQQCGVAGPVTFNVQQGSYTERVVIPEIVGMDATNTVTFDGQNKSNVTLTYGGTSSTNRTTLIFDGGDYFTFKNMTIKNTGSTYAVAILYKSQAEYNEVSSCNIEVNSSYTSWWTTAIMASASESSSSGTYGNNANFNLIKNNNITGGYCGINFRGISTSTSAVGNQYIGNTFTGQYYYAIYNYYQSADVIQYNNIDIGSRYSSAYAIYRYYSHGAIIDGNIINSGRYGIYTYRENYAYYYGSDSTMITNNMMYDFYNSSYQVGMYLRYSENLKIYHNTIAVDGSYANNYNYSALFFYYCYAPIVKNNILISTGGTMLLTSYYYFYSNATIDYNDYIYPNRTTNMFFTYNRYYADLTAWKTASMRINMPHDVNSMENVDPHFVSTTDFHLDASYPPLKGVALGLTTDVDGDARCIYETTLGADESTYPVSPPNAEFIADDTVCFGTPITFINTAAKDAKQGYWWYHNGVFKTNDLHYTTTFGAGTYSDTISLTVENCGGTDTYTKIIMIDSPQAAPNADFISDLNHVETYYPVQFTDLSSDCPNAWQWTVTPTTINHPLLGTVLTHTYIAPTFTSSQHPLISFDFPGKYKICMAVSNIRGSDSTCKEDYIVVKPSHWLCQYVLPEVEKSLSGYLYDDGGPMSNYTDNIDCEIKLDPCASEITFTLLEFNVASGDYFKVYDGVDNSGIPLWDIGNLPNGVTGLLGSANVDTTYTSNSGKLFINFTSNNSGNAPGFVGSWDGVKGNFPKPAAYFEGPDTVCLNAPVSFENLATDPGYTYVWDFDDDGFADSYGEDGDFTYWYIPTVNPTSVKLTVTSCGGDSTFTKLVYIDQPTHAPTPDFEADILKPSVGADNVSFTDLSYICADSWEWIISPDSMVDQFNTTVPTYQFKGGTNETTKNPIIVFNKKDSFDITLIAGYNGFYDTLTKVDYIIAIEYCTPSISKNSQGKPNLNPDIGISRVQLAEINNTSQIGATEYSDYVNTSGTNLDLKGTYTLTVERNTAHNSMNRKAWIDWNIDGDFDDAGETIGYESDANSLQWNKTFQVPSTATKGATRMRIATSLGNMSNNACGINMFGEYEDYRIIVRKDGTPPEITIIGQETVTIEQCNCTYFDSGATAFDNISGVIAVSDTNNLDCTTPGQYWWRYSAVDAENNVAVKDRIIIVIADTTVPTIALIGALIDTLEVYNTFVEQGWTVDDTCSGVDRVDIIGTVDTSALGENILEYVVYDNMGNTATASRTVYVVDRTLPQISLNGYSLINHEVNNTFTDPGVTYNDNYCAHNDIIYEVTGTVDTETLGTYNLSYSVTDCNGNGPVIVTRTVNVVDTTAPVITSVNYFEGDTITIEVNSTFTMPSLTLTDNYDDAPAVNETGTLIDEFAPSMLLNKLGYYTYTVTASDGSMNSSTINFVVNIVDTEAPVITLVGASIINLCRFDTLASYNYNITDNFDANPTVNVKGTYFDEYIPKRALGLYSITYDAFDQSNNVAVQVVRYVNIEECPWRSMEENGLESAVSLYPNPTKGKFVLDINLSVATDLNITITNTLGEVVKTMKLNNTKGGSYNVDISDRSSGMYFVRIQSGNNIVVKQVTLTK